MQLMALGKVPRRAFAAIVHDTLRPPTTLTNEWQPRGLCARELQLDRR